MSRYVMDKLFDEQCPAPGQYIFYQNTNQYTYTYIYIADAEILCGQVTNLYGDKGGRESGGEAEGERGCAPAPGTLSITSTRTFTGAPPPPLSLARSLAFSLSSFSLS